MIGYAINNKAGTVCYNMFHHKGLAIAIYILGPVKYAEDLRSVALKTFPYIIVYWLDESKDIVYINSIFHKSVSEVFLIEPVVLDVPKGHPEQQGNILEMDELGNLIPCCKDCNSTKSNKDLKEFLIKNGK